jgi:signal peptidase I
MKKKHKSAKGFRFYKNRGEYKKISRKRVWREITNWFLVIFAAVVLGYGTVTFLVQTVHVNGSSMSPTLEDGDVVLLNKAAYAFQDIERFDVVAIKQRNSDDYYDIKRVVGLPGETVQIVGGRIVIDGNVLTDLPFDSYIMTSGLAETPITLDSDEYFVIGDNVNNSEDSRYLNVGNLAKSEIKGKIVYRISPSEEKGKIK